MAVRIRAPRASAILGSGGLPFDFTTGILPTGVTASGGVYGSSMDSSRRVLPAVPAPRFKYGASGCLGIYAEAAAMSDFFVSEGFSSVGWSQFGVTVVDNYAIAPNGTKTAARLSAGSSVSIAEDYSQKDWTGLVGLWNCCSVYAKADTTNWIVLDGNTGGAHGYTYFNVGNGTIGTVPAGTTAAIEDVGNGWYRCFAKSLIASTGNPIYVVCPVHADGSTAATAGDAALFWGAQEEYNSTGVWSSYIQNLYPGTHTRTADAISFTIPGGVTSLVYTFDDNSTQTISGLSSGSYTVPTTLNRPVIKSIAAGSSGTSFTGSATMAATGGVGWAVLASMPVAASVAATGAFSDASTLQTSSSATIAETTAVTATTGTSLVASISVAETSAVTDSVTLQAIGAAPIAATTAITDSVSQQAVGAAVIAETSAVASSSTEQATASATITETGAITASSGGINSAVSATIAETTGFAAPGTQQSVAAITVVETNAVAASAPNPGTVNATIAATGSMAGSVTANAQGGSTIAATGNVSPAATMQETASATISETSTVNSAATLPGQANAIIASQGGLTGGVTLGAVAPITLAETGTWAAGAIYGMVAAVSFNETSNAISSSKFSAAVSSLFAASHGASATASQSGLAGTQITGVFSTSTLGGLASFRTMQIASGLTITATAMILGPPGFKVQLTGSIAPSIILFGNTN